MDLRDEKVFFFDAQTTGIRPPAGCLIEFGWATGSARDPGMVQSERFALAEGQKLPRKVTEITGLRDEDFTGSPRPEIWCETVLTPWLREASASTAIIHYAQFETPFLKHLLGEIPFAILCTHQITRRLFPTLPSQNIRAVAGYFGHPMLGPNRSGEFVQATQIIWRGLVDELLQKDVLTLSDLQEFLSRPLAKKKREISYRIRSEQRLNLPNQPGIYRMLAKTGEVLYVGKATSLKDRVNSYFRGVKGREKRKLEMLAQTWDLEVEICGSPLEAALRETDEIKRLNPRYNVSLKKGNRQIVFFDRSFQSQANTQSSAHPLGPFRPGGFVEMVLALQRSILSGQFEQIFYEPIDPMVMKAGFALFLKEKGLPADKMTSMRSLLAHGSYLYRHYVEEDIDELEESEEPDEVEADVELTAEDLAGKFERLLRRAGGELRRARRLTRILNSEVEFKSGEEWRKIQLKTGEGPYIWAGLGIEAFDRASVLLSELSRLDHRINASK